MRQVLTDSLKNLQSPCKTLSSTPVATLYRFGPFRVDLVKRRLWRGGDLIPLTPKAFETLAALVTRAGAIVEKDDLLKIVWPDSFVEEATLAQNISTIRKALGDTSDTPRYIATVPRRGYQFLATVESTVEDPTNRTEAEPAIGVSALHPSRAAGLGVLSWLGWVVAFAAIVAMVVIGIRGHAQPGPAAAVVFTISPPAGTTFSTTGGLLAVSPNGRNVAFLAMSGDGISRLWLRPLDSAVERALVGTEGASQPFWSADSGFLAFYGGGKLKKIEITSGLIQTICDPPSGSVPLAGTWSSNNDLLFGVSLQGIWRVSAAGGTPVQIVRDTRQGDASGWPSFLPDGRHFLYSISSSDPERAGIYVASLDSNERVRLQATHSSAQYSSSGHLVFVKDGALVAQVFDGAGRVFGNPQPVADQVAFNLGTGRGTFSISNTGVVAYRAVTATQLMRFNRTGQTEGPIGTPGGYLQFSMSPDAARIAASRTDTATRTADIWTIEVADGTERRLTFDPSSETYPLWSPDGLRIVFKSDRLGRPGLYEKAVLGGPDQIVVSSEGAIFPQDWLSDGHLMFRRAVEPTRGELWSVAPALHAIPAPLPHFAVNETQARLSRDGRWLGYVDYDTGQSSVRVRPPRSTQVHERISIGIGREPRWRMDGKELFYLSPDRSLMSIDVDSSSTFRYSPPRRLFQTQALEPSGINGGQSYDITPDGQHFVVKVAASLSPITVVVNWPSATLAARNSK